jgi:hypothetical protein
MVVNVRSYFIYMRTRSVWTEGEVGIVPPTTIAALIGASGVLLGLVVGRFWDVRSELRKWRRDQKIQAYQRLAEAFFAMRENLRATAEAEPETSDTEEKKKRVTQCGVEWNASIIATWIFGSTAVLQRAIELDGEIDRLFALALEKRHSFHDWHRAREPAQRYLESFIEEVRMELSLPPGPYVKFDLPSALRRPR